MEHFLEKTFPCY